MTAQYWSTAMTRAALMDPVVTSVVSAWPRMQTWRSSCNWYQPIVSAMLMSRTLSMRTSGSRAPVATRLNTSRDTTNLFVQVVK